MITDNHNLNRFLDAQATEYEIALSEIKTGRKQSHWMWYIFPQFRGLGLSPTSIYYSIKDIDEAKNYLNHPILGHRLKEITKELLYLNENDVNKIFGSPDDLKLKSSMTLFAAIDTSEVKLFNKILHKYFNGLTCNTTSNLIKE